MNRDRQQSNKPRDYTVDQNTQELEQYVDQVYQELLKQYLERAQDSHSVDLLKSRRDISAEIEQTNKEHQKEVDEL